MNFSPPTLAPGSAANTKAKALTAADLANRVRNQASVQESLFPSALLNGISVPRMTENGRISMPGLPAGLSMETYIPLLHLYASIQEADRLIHPFRKDLALRPRKLAGILPYAVTSLTPSTEYENLFYKREDQTVIRAYKARGAFCGMRRVMETEGMQHFVAASTGNHAMGVLKAAELLRPKTVQIVVPNNTAAVKLRNINSKVLALRHRGVEASVIYIGDAFDDARNWAMSQQNEGNAYYLDPYSNPWVVAGQGTIGMELMRQLAPIVTANPQLKEIVLISPIGGGGLLAGTATALRLGMAWDHRFRDLNVSFYGLRLDNLRSTYGDAIRVKVVAEGNQLVFDALNVSIHETTDPFMAHGMLRVAKDIGDKVEGPSGATRDFMERNPQLTPSPERLVVCLLSGGNVGDFPK